MKRKSGRNTTSSLTEAAYIAVLAALITLTLAVFAASVKSDDATPPASDVAVDDDPLEDLNRFTSGFNRVVRGAIIDPLVDGYQFITPEPIQDGVSNVFSNLSEPITIVSSLLQGDGDNAGNATKRFLVNSTLGLGGTMDRATDMGYAQRREDLGQAMGANGVAPGPHLVLPILGPSNFRDATGDILTGLANPLPLAVQAADGGVRYADNQDDIANIGRGAVDPYVAEREAYEQNRSYAVSNGKMLDINFPDFAEPLETNTPTNTPTNTLTNTLANKPQ